MTASRRPSRASPARASTTASRSPGATRRRRVSTLPRMSRIARSGRAARSWAARRGEPVPTRAPAGRVASVRPSRAHSASRGSSRTGTAPRTSPSAGALGRSLSEWTATSHRPSSSASRRAVTNTPVPPSATREPVSRSPSVVMRTSSVRRSAAVARSPATVPVWVSASALARVPTRTTDSSSSGSAWRATASGMPPSCDGHADDVERGDKRHRDVVTMSHMRRSTVLRASLRVGGGPHFRPLS